MKRALFICAANKQRSPTAEQVFSTWPNVETDSAGVLKTADVPLSVEQLDWADIVFVMEKSHRTKLQKAFKSALNGKRIVCLDIPDNYELMQPELVEILKTKAGKFLRSP